MLINLVNTNKVINPASWIRFVITHKINFNKNYKERENVKSTSSQGNTLMNKIEIFLLKIREFFLAVPSSVRYMYE